MIESFRTYIKDRHVAVTDEQLDYWTRLLVPKKIKKGQFLLREGEVDKHLAFVAKGCLRLYMVDDKGKEHIMQFAPENWWISDMDSVTKGTPSAYFIDAVEDSDVFLVDAAAQEKLLKTIPAVALFFQELLQNRQTATQKRIIFSMSASAEERYLDFIKTYPSLARRLPQHDIASYLGITPESLSRIRKQMVKKA